MQLRPSTRQVPPDLNQVIGERLRTLRLERGLSQDAMAEHAQRAGLPWDRPTVGRKEAGQRRFTAEELLILPIVLNCRLVDLIEVPMLKLAGTSVLYAAEPGALLHEVAVGRRPFPEYGGIPPEHQPVPPVDDYMRDLMARRAAQIQRIWPRATPSAVLVADRSSRNDAERNAARDLGVDPFDLALLSIRLWGASFPAERNRRAAAELGGAQSDPASLNARRGHVARKLILELHQALQIISGEAGGDA